MPYVIWSNLKLVLFCFPKVVSIGTIVRIEFSPLVVIGASKGHYYPEETTDEGSTRVNAETGTFFINSAFLTVQGRLIHRYLPLYRYLWFCKILNQKSGVFLQGTNKYWWRRRKKDIVGIYFSGVKLTLKVGLTPLETTPNTLHSVPVKWLEWRRNSYQENVSKLC